MDNAQTYLTILLQDNEQLKNLLSGYLNSILNLMAKYPKKYPEDTPDAWAKELEKQVTPDEILNRMNTISYFRAYATRVYISLGSLKKAETIDKETLKRVEEDYSEIKTNPKPDYNACERFVQEVNNILSEHINVSVLVDTEKRSMEATPNRI
jgi:hypothetical protein